MIVLGIESTAHTFGIGVAISDKKTEKIKIVANCKHSYTTQQGGIILIEAARHHVMVRKNILQEALKKSKINLHQIEAIAFSQGPGLAPCLIEGLNFAKELALKFKKPLVPVNHCIAHLEIGKTTGCNDPVLLYVSGANTQIIAYAAAKYRIFGETLDMGVGNFLDSFARYCGIGFPGGPKIAELARHGKYIELPYSIKGMDVAFSGLLTNLKQKYDAHYKLEDLAFSLQETAFAMLIEASERAMAHLNKKELLLGGGVACNTRLQKMVKIMCTKRKAKYYIPKNDLLLDNGAMIAHLGLIMFKKGIIISPEKADIKPNQRTDQVDVIWK
jgi:N6-L-threonylcarbamoyladenine synthase